AGRAAANRDRKTPVAGQFLESDGDDGFRDGATQEDTGRQTTTRSRSLDQASHREISEAENRAAASAWRCVLRARRRSGQPQADAAWIRPPVGVVAGDSKCRGRARRRGGN